MEELFDHLKYDELVCPLQFDLQQAHIYCDPELVLEEGCCEILPGGVSSWLLAHAVLERGQPAQGWQRSEDASASVLTLAAFLPY